ncbi:hypothetical protein TCAL_07927 [Tigriopus californicus]|uniref:Nuclear receptor domain-containing protein n=1 Tax=Tigriopus californicus TaxID=6832 RepID=A0A553PGA9_TIGCA|nr:hypothetical protein TCAL_07927 [Tigriopus californicus]|eukprot:TCALIF_07927-PA protein Name:"Similar to thrb Thyroid hormone receptor beta (Paralichthys olivaceus)" AED:0.43 eAED:0.46 QI:0/-1/0/1/-1/1/1/0/789
MTLVKRKRVCVPKGTAEESTSKECAVCGITSETFHLNYGASTCFSCRAFFRRAIERSRNPKFVCKKGGTCEVNPVSRKSCRKCRFNKCLSAGMKTDFVLDDSQKKIRFRRLLQKLEDQGIESKDMVVKKAGKSSLNRVRLKYIKKRNETQALNDVELEGHTNEKLAPKTAAATVTSATMAFSVPAASAASTASATAISRDEPTSIVDILETNSPDGIRPLFQGLKRSPSTNSETSIIDLGSERGTPLITIKEEFWMKPEPDTLTTLEPESPQILDELLILDEVDLSTAALLGFSPSSAISQNFKSFQDNWDKIVSRNPVSFSLVQSVLKFHSSATMHQFNHIPDFSKRFLHNYMEFLQNRLVEFSEMNAHFNLLGSRDRRVLLEKNGPLLAAIALGNYFGRMDSGTQQVMWFFLGDYAPTIGALELQLQSFLFTCYSLQLSQNDDHLSEAFDHMKALGAYGIQFNWIGPLINVLLFNTDARTLNLLENPCRVVQFHNESIELFQETGLNSFQICQLLNTINDVKTCFLAKIYWGDIFSDASTSTELHLPSTSLEDLWIQMDCAKIDSIIRDVSFGEEFMMECVMFNLDVPLSKTFFKTISRLWGYRFLCIMKSCSEFLQLTLLEQNALASMAAVPAFGLIQAKIEHLNSGDDQIKFGCGNNDINLFIEKYKHQIGPGNWKAMRLRDMNKKQNLFDNACENRMLNLINSLKQLVMDPTIFKVLLLYVLFSSADMIFPTGHMVQNVCQRYLMYLTRYVRENYANGEKVLSTGLSDIKVLSDVMKNVCHIKV